MPLLSLVVCVHNQRDLLERLLQHSAGCYDDLVVIHDIPDSTNVRSLVEPVGGRFFERPPSTLQEPHWPFAWGQAKHDWILRLDADEFPSDELRTWLQEFRKLPEPHESVSGFTCIWPLWDGKKAITKKSPAGRLFLFHRQRVRFFGMCEQSPVPDGKCESLNMILHHQPPRKTYGFWTMLLRKQSKRGREFIAHCLMGKPTDLVCWRWESDQWPPVWENLRKSPLWSALRCLTIQPLRSLRDQWKAERRLLPSAAISGHFFHAQLCLMIWRLKRLKSREKKS